MSHDTNLQYDPDLGEGPCRKYESLEKELTKLKSLHAKTLDEHGRMAAYIQELGYYDIHGSDTPRPVDYGLANTTEEYDNCADFVDWLVEAAERHEKK